MPTLLYFHDPMCSWCWGFRPIVQTLFGRLPTKVSRRNVLGGLAPDSDVPMPRAQRHKVIGHWRRIESMLGTSFNYDFWAKCEPYRSTFPACRAVIAAGRQGREEEMILAIQTAYFLEARNPSETKTLNLLARELRLDAEQFAQDLDSRATEQALQEQVAFARRLRINSFPTLALERGGSLSKITVDYFSHETSLKEIEKLLA